MWDQLENQWIERDRGKEEWDCSYCWGKSTCWRYLDCHNPCRGLPPKTTAYPLVGPKRVLGQYSRPLPGGSFLGLWTTSLTTERSPLDFSHSFLDKLRPREMQVHNDESTRDICDIFDQIDASFVWVWADFLPYFWFFFFFTSACYEIS